MTSPRKRGAPKGNRNALKHGFYARQLDPIDLADLAKIEDPTGLDAEIALMRVLMRRLVESSRGLTDFESLSRLARAVTFVSLAFTRLLRTRCLIKGKPDEMGDAIRQALMELNFDQPAQGQAASAASLPARPDPNSN
jgi:hypothetical protein